MENEAFTVRKKGVVSFYMDLRKWHAFGKWCENQQSNRGKQLASFIDSKLGECSEEDRRQDIQP